MATSVCSENEANCQEESSSSFCINDNQEESELANLADSIDKKECYNERNAFYKKPIKWDNIKLELEFNETPQEIRRQRILHFQKKNRDEVVNARRGLLEDILNSDNEEEMEFEEESQDMDVDQAKIKSYRVNRRYANLMMISEWMLDVPQDFTEKWIMVPCPVGKETMVIAYKGSTKMYSKRGRFLKKFNSILPGGNQKHWKSTCTILHCIWDTKKNIMYILDVLAWSRIEMLDCEAECRFFWIRSQIQELEGIKTIEKGYNDYSFELLPNIPCDGDVYNSLEGIVSSINLDGLLFYHKEVHYTRGRTPLVLWLKLFMLPEILGINVPEPYDEKPSDYIDFKHYFLTIYQDKKKVIEKKPNKKKKNKRRSKSKQEDME